MARRSFGTQAPLPDFTEVARSVVQRAVRDSADRPRIAPTQSHWAFGEANAVAAALLQGYGVRETVRRTGMSRPRIKKLVLALGYACGRFQDDTFQDLAELTMGLDRTLVVRLKNWRPSDDPSGVTSVWAWTATDARTVLLARWLIGVDGAQAASDLLPRAGATPRAAPRDECAALHISRTWFATLPESVALRVRALAAAVSLHLMFHNFCRKHPVLGVTPSMAAGAANHVWRVEDVVALMHHDRQ
jgi:hypothetical protein